MISGSWFFNRRISSTAYKFVCGGVATAATAVSLSTAFCHSDDSSPRDRPSYFRNYEEVAASAYSVLSADEDYNNLGQVSRDEVGLTVLPNAYTQIGVLLPEGVRHLFEIDSYKATRGNAPTLPRSLSDRDVLIDVGSGVGNVNLQVFCETPVKKSIGIELLPSRNAYAEFAKTVCALFYSDLFCEGKRDLEFITADFAVDDNKAVVKAFNEATVIFSHSWMFPEELMVKFGDRIIKDGPNVDLVITSRPIPQFGSASAWQTSQAELQADWNEKSPFYIYYRPPAG